MVRAGIVDEDVDATIVCPEHRRTSICIGDIEIECLAIDVVGHTACADQVDVGDRDVRSGGSELAGDSLADARRCAGHHRMPFMRPTLGSRIDARTVGDVQDLSDTS